MLCPGEMLPPVFTYFLDLSEFIRQNSHIAVRMCEADKHLIQAFIDGKLAVHSQTMSEKLERLEADRKQLEETVQRQNNQLDERQQEISVTSCLS